jgi:hypothetical protein
VQPVAAANRFYRAETVPLDSNRGDWIYSNYFSDLSNHVEKLIPGYSKNFEISVEKFRNQEVALDSIQCYETGQILRMHSVSVKNQFLL